MASQRSLPHVREAIAIVMLAFAMLSALTAPARAEIVYATGGDIWAMHDDGSAKRKLIAVGEVSGMNSLRVPSPAPSGARLAFEGQTDFNKFTLVGLCGSFPYQYSCFTTHFGYNATGVYRWENGAITRQSGAPAYCINCSSTNSDPSMRADGSVVSTFQLCTGFLDKLNYTCSGGITSSDGVTYPSCTDVDDATLNPANGQQVVFGGCKSNGKDALAITGPDGAGQRVIGCDDDGQQRDPAWSPSGDRVIVTETGTEPGLWSYSTGALNDGCFTGDIRSVLIAGNGETFRDPAYIGASRIAFTVDDDIWTIPASCDKCTFPASATQLTTGKSGQTPAWTSDPLVVSAPPGGGGSTPGGSGSTTPGGSTPGGAGAPQTDAVKPVVTFPKAKSTQQVGASQRVELPVVANEAATVSATARLLTGGKGLAVTVKPVQSAAGATTKLRIKLGPAAMRALRKAWKARRTVKLQVTVVVTDAAGNATTVLRTITLKR